METTKKPLLGRIISLLLAACIAVGFVPLIDYSVFAAEPTATIGVLESGIPRSGSGWKWDGSTLELYGAKLSTASSSTNEAQITYNGTQPLTINTIGYNYAEGNHPLIKSSTAAVTINGSGIIESDTRARLFDCKNITINGGYIKAVQALIPNSVSQFEFNGGYLDTGIIAAIQITQTGGVVNCQKVSASEYTIEHGVLDTDVTANGYFYVNGGIVKAFLTDAGTTFEQAAGDSILMYAGSDYGIATVDSDMTNQGTILIDHTVIENDTETTVSTDMNLYCKEVSDAGAINAGDDTSGVVYKNTSFFAINSNATLSGSMYIMGSIYDAYGSVASGATVYCNSLDTESALTLDNGATMYCGSMDILGGTINDSVYCRGSANIKHSEIGATGSVYTSGSCGIDNTTDDGDNTTINGSLTAYDGSVRFYKDTNPINGRITAYSKTSDAAYFDKSASFGDNAQLALYAPDGKAVSLDFDVSPLAFDTAVYNSRRTMYSAQKLGDEYMATVSVDNYHCGKAVYIGNDMGFRLDPTMKSSGTSIYIGKDGRIDTYGYKEMHAVPVDGESVKLYYDCTENIDLDDVNVTITKDGNNCTDNFVVTPSHYYKFSDGSEMGRSLCIEIKNEAAVEKGDYDVSVEYGGATQTDAFRATGFELMLDFTLSEISSSKWNYGGKFEGFENNCIGSGWEWRAADDSTDTENTLILNGLNFETENYLAIKVPANTTIILKGENKLHSKSSAIVGYGDITIIGEEDSKLTAVSDELGFHDNIQSVKEYNAVIISHTAGSPYYGNVTVKNAKLDLWGKKGADVAGSGASNATSAHCFGIRGNSVTIDNSELKITTGAVSPSPLADHPLKSICISADEKIILKGKTSLELKSAGNLAISHPTDESKTKIKSIQLETLNGSTTTLDEFNNSLKNNSHFYNGAISSNADSVVNISTKPIVLTDVAKTADIIDPAQGVYMVDLSQFFEGGTGDYIFEFNDIIPPWITLDGKIVTINPPEGTSFLGQTIPMQVKDNDLNLRSTPLEFEFTVGRVKAEVMLTIDYDDTLGTVTPATCKVQAGDNVGIRAEANGNAYISSVKVDGAKIDLNRLSSVNKNKNGRIISGEYTIEDISYGYTIEVEFKELPTFRVKVSDSENGFVTVATAPIDGKPDYTYYEGADVGLSAVAANGYRIKSAKLNGNEVALTNDSYTIENITANCDFAVEFEALPTYAVTVTCGEHGSYTTDYTGSLSAVREGTVIKFNVTPDNGYRLAKVEVDGTAISASNSFSVTITKATEIALTFSKKSSGGGGGGGTSNKPDANEPVREPYVEASSSIKGWTDIAEYITSNAAALRGKEAAIVLNGNANVPENVLKAAKAAKCTLRLKTDGLASIAIDPAESTASFNAAVSVSESYSDIMLDEGAVPAFTMTTGTRTAYAFKTARITALLGSTFSGKSATLMKYEGGRYIGVTTAAINADGTVTFDFAGISGGSYYIAVGARNYLENDVNGDNKVDVLDASLVLKQVFGVLTEEEREGLNFNRVIPANGKLSIADAQRILKQSFGV